MYAEYPKNEGKSVSVGFSMPENLFNLWLELVKMEYPGEVVNKSRVLKAIIKKDLHRLAKIHGVDVQLGK